MKKQTTLTSYFGVVKVPKEATKAPAASSQIPSQDDPTVSIHLNKQQEYKIENSTTDREKSSNMKIDSQPKFADAMQKKQIKPKPELNNIDQIESKTPKSSTKKRKRVIDEEDDYLPNNLSDDDDFVIKASDIDDSISNVSDDHMFLDDSEDETPKSRSKLKKTATKTNQHSSSSKLDDIEKTFSLHSFNDHSHEKSRTKSSERIEGSKIDMKIELSMKNLDASRHAVFSEAIVESVERERDRMLLNATEEFNDEGDGEGDIEEETGETAKKSKKSSTKSKYTPLEQQYLEIRKKYPDPILFVESGYRYKFFGRDAEIASKILNIRAGMSHNFLSTSVPVHRLHVHALRLVQAGYKVGVVSQTETAALKAISSNKSGPFSRALSALYTKSTLVSEAMDPLDSDSSSYGQYLMAIYETPGQNMDSIQFSIVAVKTSTGDIIYDSFEDQIMRSELETRLRHINPIEIVVQENVSNQTKRLIETLISSKPKEDTIRVEYLPPNVYQIQYANELVQDQLELANFSKDKNEQNTTSQSHNLDSISLKEKAKSFFSSISNGLIICFGSLAHYLKDFGLSSLICLSCNFNSFSNSQRMRIDGNTLYNLELITNAQQNQTNRGTLLATIDQTCTAFGRRRLMNWIKQPLINKSEIDERQDAVEELTKKTHLLKAKGLSKTENLQNSFTGASNEIHKTQNHRIFYSNDSRDGVSNVIALLPNLPDLERGICRIYYNKCSVSEFLSVLVSFKNIELAMPKQDEIDLVCKSALLKRLFKAIPHDLADHVSYFLDPLNLESVDKDKKDLFLNDDLFPDLQMAKKEMARVEKLLDEHLLEIRQKLGKPRLEYITKNKDEYVIELSKAEANRVPKDWIPLPGTKTCARFHTEFIVETYQELLQARETLAIETTNSWLKFISDFGSRYAIFRAVVDSLATLDCLLSFAQIATLDGYVRPIIAEPKFKKNDENTKKTTEINYGGDHTSNTDDSEAEISIKNGRHPIVEALMASSTAHGIGGSSSFVPNDTFMGVSKHSHKCTIITGPNMGGKTCYTRQVALICILAQMGCWVPAEEATITPLDAIYTRMGAYDNMTRGQSTFFVEIQETAEILKNATSRSLCILDELGRGTSTHDGFSIAFAVLHYLLSHVQCFTLFVTHYPALSQLTKIFPHLVKNYHISYLENTEPESSNNKMEVDNSKAEEHQPPGITFLHKLVHGVEDRSYGLNVAKLAHLPSDIISRAFDLSSELEKNVKKRYAQGGLKKLYALAKAANTAEPAEQQDLKRKAWNLQLNVTSSK